MARGLGPEARCVGKRHDEGVLSGRESPTASQAHCRGGGSFAMRCQWRVEFIILDDVASWLDDPTVQRHVKTS